MNCVSTLGSVSPVEQADASAADAASIAIWQSRILVLQFSQFVFSRAQAGIGVRFNSQGGLGLVGYPLGGSGVALLDLGRPVGVSFANSVLAGIIDHASNSSRRQQGHKGGRQKQNGGDDERGGFAGE